MTASNDRAPKQDRSRATRERLLAATIDLLARRGWPATTVGAVAEAAGVSRGAAQHHFPTREDLITAALEHMFAERLGQVRAGTTTGPGQAGEGAEAWAELVESVVQTVVEHYAGETFKAALQVWTAAASDPDLRERVLPLEDHFSREVFVLAADHLGADLGDEPTRRALQTTLDLARGLGLADLLSDDSRRREKIGRAWAGHFAAVVRRRPEGAQSAASTSSAARRPAVTAPSR